MSISLNFDDSGRLTQANHCVYRETDASVLAGVHTTSEPVTVYLRIGSAVVHMTPVQAESVLAKLATAVEALQPAVVASVA